MTSTATHSRVTPLAIQTMAKIMNFEGSIFYQNWMQQTNLSVPDAYMVETETSMCQTSVRL